MTNFEKKAANAMARDIESYLWELWDGESEETRSRWLVRIRGMNYAFEQIGLPVKAVWETDPNVDPFPIGVRVSGEDHIIFDKCRERWEKARTKQY